MTDDKEMEVLEDAHTPYEAQMIKTLLEDAGITAYVRGDSLLDEFAISQRVMNLSGVIVEVARDHLLEARRLVEEARLAGSIIQQDPNIPTIEAQAEAEPPSPDEEA